MKRNFRLDCLFSIVVLLMLVQCKEAPVKVTVQGFQKTSALRFAEQELLYFMEQAMTQEQIKDIYSFEFLRDTSFRKGEFSCKAVNTTHFEFRGDTPIDISHAVHTFLENLGYTFDLYSTIAPEHFNFESIGNLDVKIEPKARWRGIRQHVNFPMDISSYPIGEAKEYIRNLVRLRFNKLAVHSYPGFWYEQAQGDSTLYGGNFFYDNPHFYKGSNNLKKYVRFNDSLFCIPSMEKVYFDKPVKSKMTIAWMNELLDYAKSLGLYLQFSFEPRQLPVDEAVAVACRIADSYPMIDALELITEEMGGWGASCTRDEVEGTLKHYFGEEILKDSLIASSICEQQSDLNYLYFQLGNNLEILRNLKQKDKLAKQELKLGVYCTTGYAKPAYHLVRTQAQDIPIAFMPSHGSDGVDRAIRQIITEKQDLEKTEVYSWIEFDGLMYLQQNAINGIYNLLGYTEQLMGDEQLPSICFNHWRTAENRVTARFAAEAALTGMVKPRSFYLAYAQRIGITSANLFADVLLEINDLDSFSTPGLGNIGFCWVGAWRNPGLFKWMNTDNIRTAIAGYESAAAKLQALMKETASSEGWKVLSLLENKTTATVLYLKAFNIATDIRTVDEQEATEEEREYFVDVCNRALSSFEECIEEYAEQLPDRGSEGVIVSIWNAPMYGLKLIREKVGGVPFKENWHNERPIDSPPLPIHNN